MITITRNTVVVHANSLRPDTIVVVPANSLRPDSFPHRKSGTQKKLLTIALLYTSISLTPLRVPDAIKQDLFPVLQLTRKLRIPRKNGL